MGRRATGLLLGIFVFLAVLCAATGSAWATSFNTPVDAYYSNATNSVYLSQADFPAGAPAAVLAGSTDCPGSLTATVLAKAVGGPLLLTSSTGLDTSVRDELVRLKVTKVFLVGLSSTVASAVRTALPSLPADQVVALTGADSYTTAALVAGKVKELAGTAPARVFIVPGDVYGSSLSAAAVAAAHGWPIVLTPQAGPFPAVSKQAIADLGATAGVEVDTSVDPGITGFTVEKTIMGTTSTADDPGNRYTESLSMAQYAVGNGWATYTHVGLGEEQGGSVAYSQNFPDNVLLVSHMAREDGAYLLAKSTGLHSTVADLLKQRGTSIASVDFMRPAYDQILSGAWSFAAIRQVKSLNSPRVTGLSAASGPYAGGGTITVSGSGFSAATTVRVGKTDLAAGSWTATSDTSITITALPAATEPGAAEILVSNYWNVSPSSPADVYFYVSDVDPLGMKVVREAVKYLGTPYVWAGATPTAGFDCSGLTMYVYGKFGISLPHHAADQATYGTYVDKASLQPGDLVFFYTPIGHVGIYVGNGLMLDAPSSGNLVNIEDAWRSSYTTARRLITAGTQYDQTDGRIVYSGGWATFTTASAFNGSYARANTSGSSATVYFEGSQLDWIAMKGLTTGVADVYLDDTFQKTVDLANPAGAIYQVDVWTTGVIGYGPHKFEIRWNTDNLAGKYITLDRVDVVGGLVSAPSPVPLPAITSLTPNSGPTTGGTSVVITGTDLTGVTAVTFGGTTATTFTVDSATQITATSPAHAAGTVDVVATSAGGSSATTTGDSFTYVAQRAPIVTSVAPASGPSTGGTGVIVTGTGFTGATAVTFGGTPAARFTVSADATQIMAISPAHSANRVEVKVTTPSGTNGKSVANRFTYVKLARTTRSEETVPPLVWMPGVSSWSIDSSASYSAGSIAYIDQAGSVTIPFTGTYLAWVATTGPAYGIAKVTVDGVRTYTVDLYTTSPLYRKMVFNTGILASGPHSLKIEWTGAAGATGGGTAIDLDAVDVLGTVS